MIRATTVGETTHRRMILLGVTGENVTRIVAGEPLRVELDELGVPDVDVVIAYGRTEETLLDELRAAGVQIAEIHDRREGT